ncbi:MAG: hypothetical protein K0R65_674 [Crocinitomicaceae bacterium]|jgi:hypothetical protein|nr:hypothetical protein [Crocinitomicaceae bacterium]
MKLIALFLVFLSCGTVFYAQKPAVPRFSKHKIGSSTVSAYFPVDPPVFDESYSQDSSVVITSESLVGDHSFALVHVDFRDKVTDSLDREALLISYLDYLQQSFAISGSVGYGKGHTLKSNPQAQGIIDFWQDLDENEYSVKGWITESSISVFMVYGPGEYPYPVAKELFFEGVRY